MGRKLTTEEFKQRVYDLVADEYLVLGEYQKSSEKIKMKHIKCGEIYHVKPSNFLKGNRCPLCVGRGVKKTHSRFKQEVYDLVKDEYLLLSTYQGNNKKVSFKHIPCGHLYEVTPANFLSGRRCPKCAPKELGLRLRKTTEQFKEDVKWMLGESYKVIGDYQKAHQKIKMKHHDCGREYEVTPTTLLSGSTCPYCSGRKC